MNKIVTFYSYKGGVGRTMCLANVGVLLAKWGFKVLLIDWDLEAPGLEYYFSQYINVEKVKKGPGIIDILQKKSLNHEKHKVVINVGDNSVPIHLIPSGLRNTNYFEKVRNFNIDDYYKKGGGEFVEKLRNTWKNTYDFILIDSRTGITEINGICTVQLPDLVVLLFTTNQQGFKGTMDVANRISNAQQTLPFERQKQIFLPILTRFDTQAEFQLTNDWIEVFSSELKSLYKYWMPKDVVAKDFLITTKIPYITYFSFGEKLPVIEQGVTDPTGLGYSFENISALIACDLNKIDVFLDRRDFYIQGAKELFNRNKKKSVFISFSKNDKGLKNALTNYIRKNSKDISVLEMNEVSSSNWNQSITDIIFQVNGIIFLLSDDYYQSSTLMDEYFILQNLVDKGVREIKQIRLKKLTSKELELLDKTQLEVIETVSKDEKVYLIITDELKAFLRNL